MSIRDRLSKLWGSRQSGSGDTGALKDRLDETYRTQTALLQQVRRGVADVATSRKRVDLQLATIAQQAANLDDQARASIAAGNDEDARAALTRKVMLEKTADDLRVRRDDLKAEEDKLQLSAMKIEQDVESFRVRKDTLAARHSAASARAEINSATSGINSTVSDVGQAMEAAERRTRELEAKADAVDELVTEGVVGRSGESADDALARQFDAALDSAEVDRQLQQLTTQEDDDGSKPVQG
ncbi:PspA/IM30 family protein [Aeromicrobium wangtongii]|uniref:PspA/IM30 family protein n=1 Tax=Aeromicrobium wangtongii TaxID=2969247 RepID=A0ABY5MDB2_9ACTN|nr:PspA/IM30 family protein [Aeromicrobium wangtongii]MCD9197503.1 PspA/IM30 family protein [Aeromicrobium wangtongii]MCL3818418.1 PspA/IM30 family protein [Aeromicrobium wangtongii]UUP14995.1 PspA/IM30 family protein [Aeromicrobium wangtongii]